MANTSQIKQGRGFFVIGAILLAAGLALTVYAVASFAGFLFGANQLPRIKAPGKGTVKIEKPGRVLIYQEYTTPKGIRTPNNGSALKKMTVVARDENGRELAVVPADITESYTIGSRNGISVWMFEAPEAGNYTVETRLPSGMRGEFIISVGSSMVGGAFVSLLIAIVGLLVGGALDTIGTVLILIGVVKSRRKSQPIEQTA